MTRCAAPRLTALITVRPTDELIDPHLAGIMALSLVSDAVDGYCRLDKPTAFIKDGGARR